MPDNFIYLHINYVMQILIYRREYVESLRFCLNQPKRRLASHGEALYFVTSFSSQDMISGRVSIVFPL